MSSKNSSFVQAHVLAKYNIIQKAGSGAYGHVWKVENKKTKQTMALKKIFDAFQHATDAQRTYREVAILQQLDHPNIIKLYETIRAENNNDLYMLTEYVEADLYQVVSEGILKDVHRRFIVYQVAKALKYLHSGSLIHRDLKPSNILINSACHIKLCDFGLVRCITTKEIEDSSQILTEGVATRWYRAPEVLLGSKQYSTPADVWSFGCLIYQLLTGKPLLPGNSTIQQLQRILELTGIPTKEDIESLNSEVALTMIISLRPKIQQQTRLFEELDPSFVEILTKMLHFNPYKRMTMDQLLQHEIVRPFRKPNEEIVCSGPITTILDDNKKQSVDKYRLMIYGTKRYSLSRSFNSKEIKKNNSEKALGTLSHSNSIKCVANLTQTASVQPVMKYIKSTENLLSKVNMTASKVLRETATSQTQLPQKVYKPLNKQSKKEDQLKSTNLLTSSTQLKKTSQKPVTAMISSIKNKNQRKDYLVIKSSGGLREGGRQSSLKNI